MLPESRNLEVKTSISMLRNSSIAGTPNVIPHRCTHDDDHVIRLKSSPTGYPHEARDPGIQAKGNPYKSFICHHGILGVKKKQPSGPSKRCFFFKSALKKMLQCYYFEHIRNFNDHCGDCQVTFLNEFRQQLHPWKLTWHCRSPVFNRKYIKYIFIHGGFSMVMLVFEGYDRKKR